MAGHFVLETLTRQQIEDIQNAWLTDFPDDPVPALSGIAHQAGVENGAGGQFEGWTENSRRILGVAFGDVGVADRNGLPPHCYLSFGVGKINGQGASGRLITANVAGWVANLRRPNMGLTALFSGNPSAAASWAANNPGQAFVRQIRGNGATIEIYHLVRHGVPVEVGAPDWDQFE